MNKRDKELAKPWKWIGTDGWTFNREADLLKFADLIRAEEREACAKVCYELPWKDMGHIPSNLAFAAAIRARSNT